MQLEKKLGFDGNFTYGMENKSTNKRNLMNPDELLKLDNSKEIVMIRGRKPFICNKYMYFNHGEYKNLDDMTVEEQKERFKENLDMKKTEEKPKYTFKTF